MFTSKKAQYLNNNFEKISPITNIDSLYYEQAEKDSNGKYNVYRKSVVKHMPINANVKTQQCKKMSYTNIPSKYFNDLLPITQSDYVYLNTNIKLENLPNPFDKYSNSYLYKYNLFKIESETCINLHEILYRYATNFEVNQYFLTLPEKFDRIDSSISITSYAYNDLERYLYSNDKQQQTTNNDIYIIRYNLLQNYMNIGVQDIFVNGINETISLNTAYSLTDSYVNKWEFYYDVSNNKITYLKDEFYNEGLYDFRNKLNNSHLTFVKNNNSGRTGDILYILSTTTQYSTKYFIRNNKIYTNNGDVIFKLPNEGVANSVYICNNQIHNSKNIQFIGYNSNTNICNNIISNSKNITIGNSTNTVNTCNNKIYNSSNYVLNINNGSNNTIINCQNCSIYINGNNNYVANLKNITINLGNDNYIVNDQFNNGEIADASVLNNVKSFFNNSINTIYQYDELQNNTVLFGSNSQQVNVYIESIQDLK